MNKHYLAGFFDADGYISAVKEKRDEERKIICGFTNTREELIKVIRMYIETTYKIRMRLSKKDRKKENHEIGFDLKVSGPNAVKLLTILPIKHPKKIKRLALAREIQRLTPRNGKYKEDDLAKRRKLCEDLLNTK